MSDDPAERPRIRRFGSREEMADGVSERIADALKAALVARDRAVLALSGGSTPAPIYRRLGRRPLDWSRIDILLVDERWVGPESPDSNARMVRESLLAGPAAAARFLPMWREGMSPVEAAEAVERDLSTFDTPLDVGVLGMGDDGHTASLFPNSPALAEGLDLQTRRRCIAVPAGEPAPPRPRLTLTLGAILDARLILLLLTGAAKLKVLDRALAGDDPIQMPVRGVLQQTRTPVEIAWAP